MTDQELRNKFISLHPLYRFDFSLKKDSWNSNIFVHELLEAKYQGWLMAQ